MHKNINIDKKNLVLLAALAEGIKQVRPTSGPADLLDLATRLNGLAKACNPDSTDTIEVQVNGMYFTYPNTNALVTKAGLRVEAEAQRLTSATMHFIEDLFGGHAAGVATVGGIPNANDSDGDTNEGSDQEFFDGLKDVNRPLGIKKYMGSIDVQDPVFIPMGVNLDGQQWGAFTNESPKPRWHTKVVRVDSHLPAAIIAKK